MSPDDTNRVFWSSNVLYQLNRRDDTAVNSVILAYASQLFKTDPNLSVDSALKDLNEYRDRLQKIETESRLGYRIPEGYKAGLNAVLDLAVLTKAPNIVAGAALIKSLLPVGYEGFESFWHSGKQVTAQRQFFTMRQNLGAYLSSSADELWKLAKDSTEVAKAVDAFFGPMTSSSVNDKADDILKKNPTFADHVAIQKIAEALQRDGSLDLSLDKFNEASTLAILDLKASVKNNTAKFTNLQKTFANIWAEQQATAEAQQQIEKTRRVIAASSGALGLLTKIIGLGDKQAAIQFSAVASSFVQAASAINDYSQNVVALKRNFGDAGTLLSSAALANNLIGAVFSLTGIFEDPNAQILQQISALRQDIADLRTNIISFQSEMRLSLIHIDSKLDLTISLINEGFQKVISRLDGIKIDLDSTRRQLIRASGQIEAVQREMLNYSTDNLTAPMLEKMNYGLRFKERNPGREMPFDEYDKCASVFEYWGTELARASTLTAADFPADPYKEGSPVLIRSVDEKINGLAGIAAEWKFAPAQGTLVNPVQWLSATNAYIELVQQWPDHYQRASSSVEENLAAAGNQLLLLASSFALTSSSNGTLTGNYGLFQKLRDLYSNDLTAFIKYLLDRAKSWLSQEYGNRNPRVLAIVLGESFIPSEYPLDLSVRACSDSPLKLQDLPVNRLLLPSSLVIHSVLSKDPIDSCYIARFEITRWTNPGGFQIGWGNLVIDVLGGFHWNGQAVRLFRSTFKSAEFIGDWQGPQGPILVRADIRPRDHANQLTSNWSQGERLCDHVNFTDSLTPPEEQLVNSIVTKLNDSGINQDLSNARRLLNSYLLTQLDQDTDLKEALRRLAISKRLLNDFVELTFPISSTSDKMRASFRGDGGLMDEDVARGALNSDNVLELIFERATDSLRSLDATIALSISLAEGRMKGEANPSLTSVLNRLSMLNSLR